MKRRKNCGKIHEIVFPIHIRTQQLYSTNCMFVFFFLRCLQNNHFHQFVASFHHFCVRHFSCRCVPTSLSHLLLLVAHFVPLTHFHIQVMARLFGRLWQRRCNATQCNTRRKNKHCRLDVKRRRNRFISHAIGSETSKLPNLNLANERKCIKLSRATRTK